MKLPPLVEPAADLTVDEVRRYSRHIIIPEIGMIGQKRLKNARVLAIGAGGLGSPTLLYLAAAGVGTIGIIEFDVVDESNLQRQVIHGQSDIGRSKAESARSYRTSLERWMAPGVKKYRPMRPGTAISACVSTPWRRRSPVAAAPSALSAMAPTLRA